jgi:UDPglucose 6-dehydrogenase
MDIAVIGTGYVGLVAGTCLADLGHDLVCADRDEQKIAGLLEGRMPIYEPGLDQLVARNMREGRLQFTADAPAAILGCEVCYIAVGTPMADDGSADLSGVFAVAKLIGETATRALTVVIKSTVPVGTADKVGEILLESGSHAHEVVSNPEFLKEGSAVNDFTSPDRIICGCRGLETEAVMRRLYDPLVRTGKPIHFMDNRSAELSKYAANAFLATKISFINDLANLCERVGADVDAVRRGAGSDSRIGLRFFFPGVGYGGSCFPKDVQALMFTAREYGHPLEILEAVEAVNYRQKLVLGQKVVKRFGEDLTGKHFAIWGLSFKPRTDDMREAPSLVLIEELLRRGATVAAYDPEAMEEAKHTLGDRVTFGASSDAVLNGADALVLVTEWSEFRNPDLDELKQRMRQHIIFDGRNIYDPSVFREIGFEFYPIGRPNA